MAEIYHSVFIAADMHKVYAALTEEEGLSKWWTPKVVLGSAFIRFYFAGDYYKEMKPVLIEPDSKVEWLCVKGDDEWIGTGIIFNLIKGKTKKLKETKPELGDQLHQSGYEGEGTIVEFKHVNWKNSTHMFAECSYTWAMFLRSLKLLCETGTGNPWPNQHKI